MMILRLIFTLFILASTQHIALGQNSNKERVHAPKKMLNRKVPDLFAKTIKGRDIDSNYFKSKITLVNFYSFGCAPCFEEIGLLNNIAQTFADSNVQVLCVAAASHREMIEFITPTSKAFGKVKRRHGIDSIRYDIIAACPEDKSWLPKRPCGNIAEDFFVRGYPMTFLVDETGIIRKLFEGYPVPRIQIYDDWVKPEISLLIRRQ
jgi:thiol-disulfide isomerase/thioredoxin